MLWLCLILNYTALYPTLSCHDFDDNYIFCLHFYQKSPSWRNTPGIIKQNFHKRFNINRSSVWDGAVGGFQRASYDPNLRMSVKFSDDMGKNEESVDLGRPRREFLRLSSPLPCHLCSKEKKTRKPWLLTVQVLPVSLELVIFLACSTCIYVIWAVRMMILKKDI